MVQTRFSGHPSTAISAPSGSCYHVRNDNYELPRADRSHLEFDISHQPYFYLSSHLHPPSPLFSHLFHLAVRDPCLKVGFFFRGRIDIRSDQNVLTSGAAARAKKSPHSLRHSREAQSTLRARERRRFPGSRRGSVLHTQSRNKCPGGGPAHLHLGPHCVEVNQTRPGRRPSSDPSF